MGKTGEGLVLTQGALRDFVACPRRFQLRYLLQMPWPGAPLAEKTAVSLARGRRFHALLEQYFLGIPVSEDALDDVVLRTWWAAFKRSKPDLPDGRRWQEHQLTIPAGGHFLTGRFDLLIVSESGEDVSAHLYDWKTSRPRTAAQLRLDWQTRLYLAMLAESGTALTASKRPLAADALAMTYWYTDDPAAPRTIHYTTAMHREIWAEILSIIARISSHLRDNSWPLTPDLNQCRSCPYQVYCGRQAAGYEAVTDDDEFHAGQTVNERLVEPYTP
jgi:CRISPR/Cas system-associated exonuclease Cas4 (RecB family)